MTDPLGFSTRAIHDADLPPGIAEQPVAPPIWLTADYLYEDLEHYADVINGRRSGYVYGRYGNPTHVALHRVLASLEGAEAAWSFASGMAALHTALTSLVGSGRHLVCQRTVYGGTFALVRTVFPGYGIDVSLVDAEAGAVEAALRPDTGAVLIEAVANPTFRVADVAGIAALCGARGVPLVVDNTVATPYLLRPLAREGVSLVVHSTSKYFGGHSDVIGGAAAGPAAAVAAIRELALQQGTTAGSFEAWLLLRGVQTMALRLDRQCATAMTLARALEGHPALSSVGYPGLPSHPDHARAADLFAGGRFGAMLAVTFAGGFEAASRACAALRVARVGSSFGGLRSEVCHPATTSHRQLDPAERAAAGIDDGLVRISVGAEDPDDLVADVLQALDRA